MDPFDDPHAEVRVVIDNHGYPCLWPAAYPVPFGWTTALCPAPRHDAQAYLDSHTSGSSPNNDARSPVQ
jgi:MbtH protein